jgi:preprotein translocase subunit SecF
MKFNIVGKRFWFFLISILLIAVSVVSLVTYGLKPGIEFSSGSMLTVQFENPVDYDQFQQEIAGLGYSDAIIQRSGEDRFLIRTEELSDEEKNAIESALTARFGQVQEAQFNSVSPLVAAETTRNASIAVAIAMVGMLLYVTWAFRKMPSPFRWGTCFVIALLHDILVTVGIFSLLGGLLGWEINLMFITGILAIIGVSLDNTIVVFDRMRENMRKGVSADFEIVVNNSQVETLGRSMNTSITILITTLALLLFVGATIQNFVVTFLIGLIAGTFDSVFVAPGLLVVWDKGEWGRFIGRKPKQVKA